jgi:hypothetical protein
MKSVARFFFSVTVLIAVGLGSGYLFGDALLSYLSTYGSSDPTAINEYPWILIFSIVSYFFIFFILMHCGIGYAFRRKIKIDVLYSQAAEYAYLILTIAGLFTIADTVPTLVGALISKSQNNIEKTMYLAQGTSQKKFLCDDEKLPYFEKVDISGMTKEKGASWVFRALECAFLTEISPLRDENVTIQLKDKLQKILSDLEQQAKDIDAADKFDALNATLEELDRHRSFGSMAGNYRLKFENINKVLEDKKRIETLKAYKTPDEIFRYKFIASYVVAFSLALRLTRASAEAMKLIAK